MQTMQICHQIKIVRIQSRAKNSLKIAGEYPSICISNQLVNRLLLWTNNNCCLWQCCWCCFPLFEKCERWKRKCWLKIVSSIRMPCI